MMHASLKVNLGYRDAPAAIDFLIKALGFELEAIYTAGADHIVAHAELSWPDGGIVTLHSVDADKSSVATLSRQVAEAGGYPAFSVHLDAEQPETIFNRAREAGANVIREMQSSPMGRGFIVADPEGMYWSVGTPLPRLVRNASGQWVPEPQQ